MLAAERLCCAACVSDRVEIKLPEKMILQATDAPVNLLLGW